MIVNFSFSLLQFEKRNNTKGEGMKKEGCWLGRSCQQWMMVVVGGDGMVMGARFGGSKNHTVPIPYIRSK